MENESKVIKKSPNDHRIYKHIILKNQLEVLLISDPLCQISGASLDVNVGSMNDPEDR
jgi:secreted Zn-dependent insulinase-like peptidase